MDDFRRLHLFSLSGHAHRAALMLSLLRLPVDIVHLDLRAGDHKKASFLKLNPMGQVPVLEDRGHVIPDSNAILVYLARTYDQDNRWLPSDPFELAQVQRWLSLSNGLLVSGPASARVSRVLGVPVDSAKASADAARLFTFMESQLTSGEFLVGDHATIADIALFTYTAHAPEGGITLDPYPSIRRWLARIEGLPGFIPMQRLS